MDRCSVLVRKAVVVAFIGTSAFAWAANPSPTVDACLQAAAAKHSLNYLLLRSIAEQESSFNPIAVGGNTNGSSDFGLMQINSTWLPTLRKYGVSQQDLFNPCINADVGAWILADNFKRMGVTWDAVGAYNASTPWKRVKYATGVYNKLVRHVNTPNADANSTARATSKPVQNVVVASSQDAPQIEAASSASQDRQIGAWEAQQ